MQSEELKPCPFCGHSAHIEQRGDPRMSTIYQCDNCGCRVETGEERDYGAEWNRRAEAALSAAEPVAFTSQGQLDEARKGSTALLYGKRDEFMNIALYTAPPAPSVAVTALEEALIDCLRHLRENFKDDNSIWVQRARAALSAQVQDVAGWQRMDTAPKTGEYLVYQPEMKSGRSTLSARIVPASRAGYSRPSTHWMPLPTAPAAPAKQEGGTNE